MIDVQKILMTDGILVITSTILVNYLTRKIPAFSAIILGTLIHRRIVAHSRLAPFTMGRHRRDRRFSPR